MSPLWSLIRSATQTKAPTGGALQKEARNECRRFGPLEMLVRHKTKAPRSAHSKERSLPSQNGYSTHQKLARSFFLTGSRDENKFPRSSAGNLRSRGLTACLHVNELYTRHLTAAAVSDA